MKKLLLIIICSTAFACYSQNAIDLIYLNACPPIEHEILFNKWNFKETNQKNVWFNGTNYLIYENNRFNMLVTKDLLSFLLPLCNYGFKRESEYIYSSQKFGKIEITVLYTGYLITFRYGLNE